MNRWLESDDGEVYQLLTRCLQEVSWSPGHWSHFLSSAIWNLGWKHSYIPHLFRKLNVNVRKLRYRKFSVCLLQVSPPLNTVIFFYLCLREALGIAWCPCGAVEINVPCLSAPCVLTCSCRFPISCLIWLGKSVRHFTHLRLSTLQPPPRETQQAGENKRKKIWACLKRRKT